MEVGDKIIDMEMSQLFKMRIVVVITDITDDLITVNNDMFPKQYPHMFLMDEQHIKWCSVS